MAVVSDFARELKKQAAEPFAQWHRIDLHNHSPKSFDYRGDPSTAAELTATRLRETGITVVMFTDHGELPDPTFTEAVSSSSNALVLRGVELNVFVPAWNKPERKVDSNLFFHILLGFDPDGEQGPDYWLDHIYRTCQRETRSSGEHEIAGIRAPIEDLLEAIEGSNALIIPAHLHSNSDAFKTRSIDDIYADQEFLRFARDHFTALEVLNDKTAAFFDGKHAETGYLEQACIRSSDSHIPSELGARETWAQMERVTYEELKAALGLPFRIRRRQPQQAQSFVAGLHIQGHFLEDTWLTMSPHCNVLIGVKGSGKTSVLECLRFALGADVPQARSGEVSSHLDAILGPSGKVRVLVHRDDGARLLVERSRTDRLFRVTFEDDRVEAFENPEAFAFATHILGWHEIEQAATDANIRRGYLDTIAGKEKIRSLGLEALELAKKVKQNHEVAAEKYRTYREFDDEVNRLSELRRGLKELTDENLIDLKTDYETAQLHRNALTEIVDVLAQTKDPAKEKVIGLLAPINETAFSDTSPLGSPIRDAAKVLEGLFFRNTERANNVANDLDSAREQLASLNEVTESAFRSFVSNYDEKVSQLSDEQKRLLESHRKVMEETQALPRLEIQRDLAKSETEGLLAGLVGLCESIARILEDRTELRQTKVDEFNKDLAQHGVRLRLQPRIQPRELLGLRQRYSDGWQLYQQIGQVESKRSLFHDRLKTTYERLQADLMADVHVYFQQSQFLYFVEYLEDDDLLIEFDVLGAGAEYRPIENLSAGQRCTAVFPILLRLGDAPLIIDQPEDNLDNRHIASKTAPALLEEKANRQTIFTSHNANLVVLSDPEQIMAFEGEGDRGRVLERGFLATSNSAITAFVLDIVDGGERALEQRYMKYKMKA